MSSALPHKAMASLPAGVPNQALSKEHGSENKETMGVCMLPAGDR